LFIRLNKGMPEALAKALHDNNQEQIRTELEKIIINNDIKTREELAEFINYDYSCCNQLIIKANLCHLFPLQKISKPESEILEYLQELLPNTLIEQSNRKILSGKELDLYIPSRNLAIEFDGIYWHSVNAGKDKNYHLEKTLECEKQGIQLLHIFESEWYNKKEIWKSIIAAKLGIFKRRLYARKCSIQEIDSKAARAFLDKNHLSGFANAKVHLGLFHEEELVSVLSYGTSRFNPNKELEIIRFASLLNTQVVGGLSKLVKHINQPLTTFADRRYSSSLNNSYSKFMILDSISGPAFWAYDSGELKHRLGFQKHLLKNKIENFDASRTAMDMIIKMKNYMFNSFKV
jgi:hypothetical protein